MITDGAETWARPRRGRAPTLLAIGMIVLAGCAQTNYGHGSEHDEQSAD